MHCKNCPAKTAVPAIYYTVGELNPVEIRYMALKTVWKDTCIRCTRELN